MSHTDLRVPLFFLVITYSQASTPELNFPAGLSRDVSPAATAAAKLRGGFRESARSALHWACASALRARPVEGSGSARWGRLQPLLYSLHSGGLGAPLRPARPTPWSPGGQRAWPHRAGPQQATASGAEAAAVTPPPGRRCETGRASPPGARAPAVGVWATPDDGLAAGAPRHLGPGPVRGPAGVGERRPRSAGPGTAGAMEGVLYKWTNYLSGECLAGPGRRGPGLCLSCRGAVCRDAPPWGPQSRS